MPTYRITDDSGFLAIVNPEKYHSFVQENWQFSDLLERFKTEMSQDHLIIWSTGREGTWNVQVLPAPSNQIGFRQFEKTIDVTNGQLLLTNFEDITMAAQFADMGIVSAHNQDQLISIENGFYQAILRQMSDPEVFADASSKVAADFELIFVPLTAPFHPAEPVENIFWWSLT